MKSYLEFTLDMLDDMLFVVVEDKARLDEIVKSGEDERFFHGRSDWTQVCGSDCWRWNRNLGEFPLIYTTTSRGLSALPKGC